MSGRSHFRGSDWPLFVFNTALLYSAKGYQFKLLNSRIHARASYFEIPLNIEYKYALGDDISLFAEAGPYMGIGLSAKLKTGKTSFDVDFGNDEDEQDRIDAGLNFGAGIEVDKIRLGVNYGHGMVNLANNEWNTKLRNVAIYAGYRLN
ncbi:MAG: PorT family protein [Cyclobacteriaceae bacterium]|nr:PorT family protein [Cyclobacteriaceae bacterium]